MTTSRPDDYRKCPSMRERSSRDNVYSYIFQLQTEALRALPESGKPRPGDKFPLRGKRTPGDERKLRLVVNSIFDSLRDLEKLLPPEDDSLRHAIAYSSLYFLLAAAGFVGSRARMSLSQKTFFEAVRNKERGQRSGRVRGETADAAWRTRALSLAQSIRGEKPSVTKTELFKRLKECLDTLPDYDSVRRFLTSEEKAGRLPSKVKKKIS
jgi:hypothetical protein